MIYICLAEPEIPQNTGNIARTCVATGSTLVLIHPLGFSLDEKAVRRSGLDYWKDVSMIEENSFDEFLLKHAGDNLYFFSSHAKRLFNTVSYPSGEDIFLVFGKESVGLGEKILEEYSERTVRIPMVKGERCLNLSNSAAVAVYEVLRQTGYEGVC